VQAFRPAVTGALLTAAVSTFGDYLWANVLPHGQPVYWFAHGCLLFMTAGFCLGLPSGRPLTGALGAAAIGCAATAGYWVLQPLIGYSAMPVLFVALWVGLGLLTGRVLQRSGSMRQVLLRSVAAAVGSGLAFYLAISSIWMPFDPRGWDYARHFAYWTVAYLPGFVALLPGRRVPL
jgi:hypothetical protein